MGELLSRSLQLVKSTIAPEKGFGRGPLLPYDQLQPAELLTIGEVEPHLQDLHQLGQDVTNVYDFTALAFTQLPDNMFTSRQLPKIDNIIYCGSDLGLAEDTFTDMLLINPTIEVDEQTPTIPFIEACGSIFNANIRMVIERPYQVYASGYAYRPAIGLQIIHEVPVVGFAAAQLLHEAKHLDGKTALDNPQSFLHPFNPKLNDWPQPAGVNGYMNFGFSFNTARERYLDGSRRDWLAFKDGQFCRLTPDGRFRRALPTLTQSQEFVQ